MAGFILVLQHLLVKPTDVSDNNTVHFLGVNDFVSNACFPDTDSKESLHQDGLCFVDSSYRYTACLRPAAR